MPNRIPAEGKYNFIDLFAGAGGLSEGFIQAGFNPIAHVEMNSFAAQTLVTRSAYYYLKQVKQLDIYYQYLRGEITRDAFLEKIPNRITKTVICETMSNDTLPGIFKTIDGIMKLRKRLIFAKKLMKRRNNFRRFKHHSIRKSLPSKKRPKEKLLSLTSNLTYSRFCLSMSC